nr:p22 protein [Tea plant necrotic ring blotch virus]
MVYYRRVSQLLVYLFQVFSLRSATMVSVDVVKYVALQLLVLSGYLDEDLTKNGSKILPISFPTPITPSNLPNLMVDVAHRVSQVVLSKPSVEPTVPQGLQGSGNAARPVVAPVGASTVPQPQVQTAIPHLVAAAPAPVGHPLTRRRRSVEGTVSEIADTVGGVAETIADHPISNVMGVAPVAQIVAGLSNVVEEAAKPETTVLGELLLSE